MPFEMQDRLGHNWFIRKNVEEALRRHEAEGGMADLLHLYIGDTERINEVVQAFAESANLGDVESARLYVRLSCTNKLSGKYHVVSLYQTERVRGGSKKQILEATWTPKAKMPLTSVVEEIQNAFQGITQGHPKYGGKLPEIVGSLHEFRR